MYGSLPSVCRDDSEATFSVAAGGDGPSPPLQAEPGRSLQTSFRAGMPMNSSFFCPDQPHLLSHEPQHFSEVLNDVVTDMRRLADSADILQSIWRGYYDSDSSVFLDPGTNVPLTPPRPAVVAAPMAPRAEPQIADTLQSAVAQLASSTTSFDATSRPAEQTASCFKPGPLPPVAVQSTVQKQRTGLSKGSDRLRQKTISQLFAVRSAWCDLSEEAVTHYERRYRLCFGNRERLDGGERLSIVTCDVDWDRERGPAWVAHPSGPQRIAWNLNCLLLILYDIIMVPLQAFQLPSLLVLDLVEWMCTLCWTMDVLFSFRTGYYISSDLEMRPREIAKHYAQTWLPIDTFIVVLDWVTLLASAVGSGANLVRITRVLRILRCLRLLRVAKMQVLFSVVQDQINSSVVYLCFGLLKMAAILVVGMHALACIWYALGEASSDGWTSYYALEGTMERTVWFWYFASSRWTLAQINGRTDTHELRNMPELIYTCFVAVGFAIIFMTVFYGSVTASMMELNDLAETKTKARRLVNAYLKKHDVSSQLVGNAKQHLASTEIQSSEHEEQIRVLALLPPDLGRDLLYEVRQPVLSSHRWFSGLNREFPRAVRHICHAAVEQVWTHQREVVFERGDACNSMLFVDSGRMHYRVDGWDRASDASSLIPSDVFETGVVLLTGQWVSEPALWVEWVNRGRMVAGAKGCLFSLEAADFAKLLREYRSVYAIAVLYAKDFIRTLQQSGATSDILDAPSPY